MNELSSQEKAGMLDNCRKATFLIEKQQTEGITLKEQLELTYHLDGCEMCRIFERQSSVINQVVKKISGVEKSELRLDDEFKEQLQNKINIKHDESFRKE